MPIDRPTFATTRLRTGYDTQQVDLAVEMILENLSLPQPRIAPRDLDDIRFSTVSYQLGYDIEQVDDWLGDVSDELAQLGGSPATSAEALEPASPAPSTYAPTTRSDAIIEVKSDSTRWLLALGVVIVLAVLAYVALA